MMGYMGLDNYEDSDMAADLAETMKKSMAKVLNKGLKVKTDEYNTDGVVNVAMIFEDLIIPCAKFYKHDEDIINVALKTQKLLRQKLKNAKLFSWARESDSKMYEIHTSAYKRMLKAINKFIKTADLLY